MKDRKPAHNSTYKKLAVHWLNEHLFFVSSSVVADSGGSESPPKASPETVRRNLPWRLLKNFSHDKRTIVSKTFSIPADKIFRGLKKKHNGLFYLNCFLSFTFLPSFASFGMRRKAIPNLAHSCFLLSLQNSNKLNCLLQKNRHAAHLLRISLRSVKSARLRQQGLFFIITFLVIHFNTTNLILIN
jgi:hypothetical protein